MSRRLSLGTRYRQGGAGSLALVMLLWLGAALALLYANRALIFEQRAIANQVRATRALAAADAGVAWALAMLNQPGAINASCQPSNLPSDASFADRLLGIDAASGALLPNTQAQPACVADAANAWHCGCPSAGAASLVAPGDVDEPVAFGLRWSAGPRPHTLRLAVQGCSGLGSGCGGGPLPADAVADVEVTLAPLGALARPPYATLTARQDIQLSGDVRVVNADLGGSALALSAGGDIQRATSVQLLGPPGSPSGQAAFDATWQVGASPTLMSSERFFAHHFGLAASAFRNLPGTRRLDCSNGCSASTLSAVLSEGARLLWISGNLLLDSPVSLGSQDRPIALIVDGALQVNVAVQITGLVYARSLQWQSSSSSLATLQGALLSSGPVVVDGRVTLVRDAQVLQRLRWATGSFAPLPGSWRDLAP